MDVFVYGTLTDPSQTRQVLDRFEYRSSARIVGLRRIDGRYPTLAPGDQTEGRILQTDEIDALDEYEGTDRGLYVRVSVPSERGPVAVYIGDPALLDAPVEWPGEGSFEQRVDTYLSTNDVHVERDVRQ